MDIETIRLIVQYGLIGLFALVFLWGFIVGVIRGRYRVLVRLIYVVIFMLTFLFLMPLITRGLLNIPIPFGINMTGKEYIENLIQNNEEIQQVLEAVPSLKPIAFELAVALVTPLLYIITVWVGLILFFPIYIIYVIIVKLIMKKKRPKYEMVDGQINRDMSNKKIKIKYKKHRLTAGLIRGIQAVFVFSIILMPLNMVTRLYNHAKSEAGDSSVSLCESITLLQEHREICEYIELYTNSVVGKVNSINFVDELAFKQLARMKVNGEVSNVQNELEAIISAAVHLERSGVITLIMEENTDMENLDLSTVNSNEVELAINSLMKSKIFSTLVVEGVNYGLTLAQPELVKALEDENFVLNFKYTSDSFKEELDTIVGILKIVIDNNLVRLKDASFDDPLSVKELISEEVLSTVVSKLLDIKIARQLIPHVAVKFLGEYGAVLPEGRIDWNEEKKILLDTIKLAYTIETIDPKELINSINKQQITLVGKIMDDINNSAMFMNILPNLLNQVISENLQGLNFDVNLLITSEWEEEFNKVGDSFEYIRESGLIGLLTSEDFDINTLDPNEIDFVKVKSSIESIFDTNTVATFLLELANYSVVNYLPELGTSLEIDINDIDLTYTVNTLENDLLNVIDLAQIVLTNDLVNVFGGNQGEGEEEPDIFAQIKSISKEVYNSLIDKTLDVEVTKKIMPKLVYKFLGEYGAVIPDEPINWEVEAEVLKDVISLIYVIDDLDNPSTTLVNLSEEDIALVGSIFDKLATSAMFKNILSTSVPKLLGLTFGEGEVGITAEDIESVESWTEELTILHNLFLLYDSYSSTEEINYDLVVQTLDLIIESDLIMRLMPTVANYAMPSIDPEFVMPEDIVWETEIGYIRQVFVNLPDLGEVDNLGFDVVRNETKRTALGNIIDAAFASKLFGNLVSTKTVELANAAFSDFGVTLTKADLDNVDSWGNELNAVNNLLNDFVVEDENGELVFDVPEINKALITSLFNNVEALTLLTNHRVNLLVFVIESAGFMNEEELAAFRAIDKSTVVYQDEKTILISILEYADVVLGLGTLSLETMNADDLGDILNYIYGKASPEVGASILLKGYISNKILGLLPSELTVTQEKLEAVHDWKVELGHIKSIVNNPYDVSTLATTGFDFVNASAQDTFNVGMLLNDAMASVILKDAVADEMVDILTTEGFTKTRTQIQSVPDWIIELALIKSVVNSPFDFDDVATFNIKTATAQQITDLGTLLNNALDTYLFADEVATELALMLANENINKTNQEIIAISNWVTELELIHDSLNMDGNSTHQELQTLFTNIEASELLSSEKERILVEVAHAIDNDVDPNTVLTSTEYENEKDMLLKVVENKTLLETVFGATYSFKDETDANLVILGGIIDDAATSVLFEDKVETEIKAMLLDNDITYTGTLADGSPWYNELKLLQDALNVDTSITPDNLETLLTNVGTSAVLSESKWVLLNKVITSLGIPYVVNQENGWTNEVANLVNAYETHVYTGG